MKTKNILIIMALCLFSFCCKKSDYYSAVAEVVKSQLSDSLKQYDMVIIIPGSGCTGCITVAENFFLKNVQNTKNKFILTHNFSKKNIVLKLGKENIVQPNVLIDDKDIFYLNDYEEKIYPIAIKIRDGKVLKVGILENII
jgi:hypothetical protein